MASVAAALKDAGRQVTGSDHQFYPPTSTLLTDKGIDAREGFNPDNLDPAPDMVVIGNAISRGNPEAEAVLNLKLPFTSLPEFLKYFFIQGKRSLVVSGTHGKTTVTSLLAWVFDHNQKNPSFLIGGMPENFDYGARLTEGEWFIIEGDEYDTAFFDKRSKFLHYLPEVAIINNLEFDHADIFSSLEEIQKSFTHFTRLIPQKGLLLANGDDPNLITVLKDSPCPVQRFGLGPNNDVRPDEVQLNPEDSVFRIRNFKFRIPMVGEANVRNALSVVACARHCGLTNEEIQSAFLTFKGIKRRLEIRGIRREVAVVDDFGHHPTAIRESLRALRIKYPRGRIWAIFEPRTNTTRRNILQTELTQALAAADVTVLTPIAREELLRPEERLNPEQIIGELKKSGREAHYLRDANAIVTEMTPLTRPGDVLCVFSNGGFDDIHEKLLNKLV